MKLEKSSLETKHHPASAEDLLMFIKTNMYFYFHEENFSFYLTSYLLGSNDITIPHFLFIVKYLITTFS